MFTRYLLSYDKRFVFLNTAEFGFSIISEGVDGEIESDYNLLKHPNIFRIKRRQSTQ